MRTDGQRRTNEYQKAKKYEPSWQILFPKVIPIIRIILDFPRNESKGDTGDKQGEVECGWRDNAHEREEAEAAANAPTVASSGETITRACGGFTEYSRANAVESCEAEWLDTAGKTMTHLYFQCLQEKGLERGALISRQVQTDPHWEEGQPEKL
jgi:hypothetical protein